MGHGCRPVETLPDHNSIDIVLIIASMAHKEQEQEQHEEKENFKGFFFLVS